MAEKASAGPPARRRLRPGTIDLYLIRGAAGPFLAMTLGLCLLMMLERALRVIHLLAASGGDIGFFLPMMVQLVPYYLNLALPAAFMAALMLLVARLDDHLELEAMLAAGFSLARIAAPLILLGAAVSLASLAVGGWLEPIGRHGFNSLKGEAVNAGRIGRLPPRAFHHPADGLAISFDRRAPDGALEGVFVSQRGEDGPTLTLTGASARIGFDPGERRLALGLRGGRYLAERPGEPPVTFVFNRLELGDSLRLEEAGWARGWSQKELTLSELIRGMGRPHPRISEAEYRTELYSRIARALSIPLIPLLVLPLAFVTKNGRRGLGLLLGGVILAGFHHAINFARQPALAGEVAPETAIGGVTAAGAALALTVFWSGRHLPSRSPVAAALKPAADALARLRPREGRLRSPGGWTLATYIAWRFGKWALGGALAIVLLLQLVDLLERGEEFAARGMGLGEVALYAWLRLPVMLHQAIPIAALAGAMAVFAALGRSREMVAIRAAGLSQYRVLAMALPVPVLLATASWTLAERVVPASEARLAAWWAETDPAPKRSERWFRIGSEIVRAGAASADGGTLGEVEIFRRDGRGLLVEQVAALRATHNAEGWRLGPGTRTGFAGNRAIRTGFADLAWPTPLRPEDVSAFFAQSPLLSSAAAQRSLEEAAPVSASRALFETRLQRAWAEPLAPFVMLLLALPLAFAAAQRRLSWPALLYAGGGGLLYLVADGVLTVAAQVGALAPAVGAWTAPLLFILGGLTVLVYRER